MISPKIVIKTAENANALKPAKTESDNNVSKTLIPTLPHKMVVSKKLESCLILSTLAAAVSLSPAFTSNCKRFKLKKAKFKPENIADCVRQKTIPIHIQMSGDTELIICVISLFSEE